MAHLAGSVLPSLRNQRQWSSEPTRKRRSLTGGGLTPGFVEYTSAQTGTHWCILMERADAHRHFLERPRLVPSWGRFFALDWRAGGWRGAPSRRRLKEAAN